MRVNKQKSASTQDDLNSFNEADMKLSNLFLYISDWGRKGKRNLFLDNGTEKELN